MAGQIVSKEIAQPVIEHAEREHLVAGPATQRQTDMPDTVEHIETLHRTADSIGDNVCGDVSGVDAVTAVALHEIQIGFETPYRRNARNNDANAPAPSKLDALLPERGEYLEEPWGQGRGYVLWIAV